MQVLSLYLYPVKSLAGIRVDQLHLDEFGPSGDRRWMITDVAGRFLSQRSHPTLARISVASGADGVTLTIPGQGAFRLLPGPEQRSVTVWDDRVGGTRALPGPAEAIGRFLGQSVDLVYMAADRFRPVRGTDERHQVAFSDGFPFLLTNEASLDELKSRLNEPVDMRRFRPNIVISGAPAWAEDGWASVSIGDVRLDLVKPCSRCILTTVDPDTGVRDPRQEPLRTLGTYRRRPEGVMFGMNAVHTGAGPLRVGDSLSLIRKWE